MPKYNKLSPSDFRKKLKNGEYESLTGAKRAIGKMQEWTEKERNSARTAASKHFGEEPAPAKKVAKKTSKKKATVKKAEAKKATTKKTAKKTAKKAASKYGPGKGGMPKPEKAKKASAKKAAPKKSASKSKEANIEQHIETAARAMGPLTTALEALKQCKEFGEVDVSKGLTVIADTTTRLVEDLDRNVVQHITQHENAQAAKFAQAKPIQGAPGNGAGAPLAQPQMQPPPVQPPPVASPVVPPTSG
jgi:hypothetical protein